MGLKVSSDSNYHLWKNFMQNLFATCFQFCLFIFYLKFVGSTCHSDFFFKNQFLVVPENEMNMGKKLQLSLILFCPIITLRTSHLTLTQLYQI